MDHILRNVWLGNNKTKKEEKNTGYEGECQTTLNAGLQN